MEIREEYQVFISYRRDGGDFFAQLLHDRLEKEGYSVFLDVEALRAGKFNEALLRVIEQCTYFICVLPPNGMDRCVNEDDWLRREITCAIRLNKCIIPVMLRGFEFPDELPAEIDEIRNYQAIKANDTDTFPYAMQKLIGYMDGNPVAAKRRPTSRDKRLRRLDAIIAIYLGIWLAAFLLIKHFYTPQSWMPDFLDRILFHATQVHTHTRVIEMVVIFIIYKWAVANNLDYNRANCAKETITLEQLAQPPEQLLKRMIEIDPKPFVNEIDAPESARATFAQYRAFEHMEFGSVDGKQVDYLLVKGYGDLYWRVCILYLSLYTVRSGSARMLARQGFVLVDSREKDVARFQCGEFQLTVQYGSFGLTVIGLELRRGGVDYSRLIEANEPYKSATIAQTLLGARDALQQAWKSIREGFREIRKEAAKADDGDPAPTEAEPPAEADDDPSAPTDRPEA